MNAARLLVVFLGALLASQSAFAACTNTVTVKDGAGVSQTFCRGTDGTNMISSVNILDSAGTNFAAVTAANALKIDGSAVTQPVSGTITANQGGTWTVQPGNTANTTAWLVTGTGGVFPATQSGAWTTRGVGNAGGILDFAGQNAAQPANSLLTGCEFNTTPTTIVSGNASPIQCTSAARLIVDGSQVTQPVSGTVTANQGGNWTTRIVGNAGATLDSTVAAGAAPTNGVAILGQYNTTVPTPTAAQTVALQTNQNGYLLAEQGCAGQSVANTNVTPFSLASTTSLKLVSKVAAKKVYICAIDLVSATAQNVALIEGTLTTTNCDTSTAGLAGGTTAATGWNLAANGGLTKGNGQGVVYKSATANLDVCLLSSSTGQISGAITWAQF